MFPDVESEAGMGFRLKRSAWLRISAGVALSVCSLAAAGIGRPQSAPSLDPRALHTDPLNLDPTVRDAYRHIYNLDYDGAIARFDEVLKAHPDDPMAYAYDQMAVVFRELYHQDLLDTTYYAHDSFLTSKRNVPVPDATRQRIESLTNRGIQLADDRIKADARDKNAYFARGYMRGIHAVFITLVDHSFVAAAHQGYDARNDSEQVLKIDPAYADAKMAIGIQQFAVASLPRLLRFMVGMVGVGGNKERGLTLLREAAEHGVVTSVESRTVLSLFLRHDGRYPEALQVQHGLAAEFPHNYLFRLEDANLTKDEGNGPAAIALYKRVIADAGLPGYFIDPRLQLAFFGLADTERGQHQIPSAAADYVRAASQPNSSDWLRRRAQLNAGEMYDLLGQRAKAIGFYEEAAAGGGDQSQADTARRYQNTPFTGT
jgi:tetratricopeptide (TPR) repeat protein